jgi:hypothetical protein
MSKKINFEQPIFYIAESPLLPNCSVRKTSQIVMDNEIPQILSKNNSEFSTYVMSNPMNLMEIQQYLFDETMHSCPAQIFYIETCAKSDQCKQSSKSLADSF